MIAGRHSDPALRLLIEADPDDAERILGTKALLILAGHRE
jgi:hypothetical protein